LHNAWTDTWNVNHVNTQSLYKTNKNVDKKEKTQTGVVTLYMTDSSTLQEGRSMTHNTVTIFQRKNIAIWPSYGLEAKTDRLTD